MHSKISHDKRQGIETIICLDISNSMLAEDVVPSRLDKSNSLGTTTVEYKQNYNYKDLKDLHNPVNENLSRESWVKTKINKKAVNPTRDYIENAAVDGSRVSGARNTYHEPMLQQIYHHYVCIYYV